MSMCSLVDLQMQIMVVLFYPDISNFTQVFCLVLLETCQRWPKSGNTILLSLISQKFGI